MLLILCFLLLSLRVTGGEPVFTENVIEQIEAQLSDSCGTSCIGLFREMVPMVQNVSLGAPGHEFSDLSKFVSRVVANGKTENARIIKQLNQLTLSSFANVTANASVAPTVTPRPQQPGVPCTTQAECDSIDFRMSRCAHIRHSALKAYTGANAALSVMANMITVTCGCMFAGPVNVCVLRGIPYTCGFPFYAYSGLYGLSQSLYSAVTITSSVCSVVGSDTFT